MIGSAFAEKALDASVTHASATIPSKGLDYLKSIAASSKLGLFHKQQHRPTCKYTVERKTDKKSYVICGIMSLPVTLSGWQIRYSCLSFPPLSTKYFRRKL